MHSTLEQSGGVETDRGLESHLVRGVGQRNGGLNPLTIQTLMQDARPLKQCGPRSINLVNIPVISSEEINGGGWRKIRIV
jgi:hypothetical protein